MCALFKKKKKTQKVQGNVGESSVPLSRHCHGSWCLWFGSVTKCRKSYNERFKHNTEVDSALKKVNKYQNYPKRQLSDSSRACGARLRLAVSATVTQNREVCLSKVEVELLWTVLG